MIVMTYSVYTESDNAPDVGLIVHTLSPSCGHMWNTKVPTEARMRMKNKPKAFYRFAENVLLSAGKVEYAMSDAESKVDMGDWSKAYLLKGSHEKRVLKCKECK